ncbi:hypothetical protein [Pseudomonas brassicacearum]|uniref:hypothetical protein n=1 Tax=Pseudomonas brassicacearum TaxID=930166 RepID=UPI0011CD7729|nr:hypothetical protein [Pseudomonas brassicacearum]
MRLWNEVARKKRVNPPTGAIKDRWIGGFGGKSKISSVKYSLKHQAGLLGSGGFTPHDQRRCKHAVSIRYASE